MNKIVILSVVFLNLLIGFSYATKPCSDSSYFSNSKRDLKEWIELSRWAVILEIKEITHNWGPFPNCYLENKKDCAQFDNGTFKAKILNILKGQQEADKINLVPVYCSKDLPDKLGIYIFYGVHEGGYDGYELIKSSDN